MSRSPSIAWIAPVAAALPDEGKRPREIAAAVPDAPLSSVRTALLALVRAGEAVAEGEIGYRRYRRAGGAS